ncbi:MAG: phosphatidylglycerophosphatase A [Holophagae bacterium]|jgi:phosphatidylglycerophosphatase A
MTENHNKLASAIATCGGLGARLPAPGTTVGSLPICLVWVAFCVWMPITSIRLAFTAVGLFLAAALGTWASEIEAQRLGSDDPREIVIDEVAGQLLVFLVALPFVVLTGITQLLIFAGLGFFLFRLFDVVKPWPVRVFERFPGGIGIVADDLAAGYLAAAVLAIGWRLAT